MKKLLIALLALAFLFTGCAGLVSPQETPLPTETPTGEATEAPTALPEAPYKDPRSKYAYITAEGRDRRWEEDVVYFANVFLDPYSGHAVLCDRVQSTFVYNSAVLRYADSGSGYFYDAELRQRFIDKINEIILSIPERSDSEIVFGLWEACALIGDLHSSCRVSEQDAKDRIPIVTREIMTGDGAGCVIDACLKGYEDVLLGSELLAVNGFTLGEIREKLKRLSCCENEYALNTFAFDSQHGCMSLCPALRYVGVLDGGDTAALTVRTPAGEEKTVTVPTGPESGADDLTHYVSGREDDDASYRLIDADNTAVAWYRLLEDGETLYFRIKRCDADETFTTLLDEAFGAAEAAGKLKKVIVDVRSNPGGYPDLDGNYINLVNRLNDTDADVYVLINGKSFSGAIALPSMLRRRVEKALIVGSPGGQPVRFFYAPEFTMPNSGIVFKCSTLYGDYWPGYEGDALMPDITVYQTYEDYLEGYDSVLKYLLTPQ